MSFVDLATVALHRRNEMGIRISTFAAKCDQAINDLRRLKTKSRTFVERLNCEPAELKDRFLACMKQLDEYIYLVTDFNLAIAKLEENGSMDMAPVQDTSYVAYPILTPTNLMDVLSEPTPSTSTACPNMCPVDKPRRRRIPKEDQLLIAFSSASCSAESVPEARSTVEKEVQCSEQLQDLSIKDPDVAAVVNLPAQAMLQVDHVYPATIMSTDGVTFWIITDTNDVFQFILDMNAYYKDHKVTMTIEQIAGLSCCVCYDVETQCYYRALFIGLSEDSKEVELFLVDTGEFRWAGPECVQPIAPRFCNAPPYARCCHLADVDLLCCRNTDLVEKHEEFIKDFIGKPYKIRVDDNASESLGVYVLLDDTTTLNERLVEEGLALAIDKSPLPVPPSAEPNLEHEIEDDPELEDPLQAVTGYSNRDEIDICKHYKGGPERTCFKGSRCKKRHVLQHPDGWTLDRVPVARCPSLLLPEPGTWHRVHVTYICHFDRIYVQFVTDEVKEERPSFGVVLPPMTLESLVRDMNSPAARMAYKQLELAPAPGELVAALYPADDQWYRARVAVATRADQSVNVIYIDYGNEVWVKENAIRALEPRFLALPAQAMQCRLAGVLPRSNNTKQWAAAKSALVEMTQDRTLDARVISRDYDKLTIELIDSQGFSVAEQLEARGFTLFEEFEVTDDTQDQVKIVAG